MEQIPRQGNIFFMSYKWGAYKTKRMTAWVMYKTVTDVYG